MPDELLSPIKHYLFSLFCTGSTRIGVLPRQKESAYCLKGHSEVRYESKSS